MRTIAGALVTVVAVLWSGAAVSGAEWHVAPTGTPAGDGSAAKPWDLLTALKHPAVVQPGDILWLHGGAYLGGKRETFSSELKGAPDKPIILRQFPGERATVSPTLTIGGENVWYWGFEVTNPDPKEYGRIEHARWPCVWMRASKNIKLINLVIHGGGQGIGAWVDALDTEICGCVIYHNGWNGSNQGHGIYTQNKDGAKRIVDNIIFNQLGTGFGIHAYGSTKAFVSNFFFEGNVAFNNKGNNILVGGEGPAENVTLRGNYAYAGNGVRVGYTGHNKNAVVENNYWATKCVVNNWDGLTFRNNTLVNAGSAMQLDARKLEALPKYEWDGNSYFCPNAAEKPFTLLTAAGNLSLNFEQWKEKTGCDAASRFTPAAPTGLQVVVRPNSYEKGRANLIIYNWDKRDAVEADVALVLAKGDAYEVRDPQDWFGAPIAAGTYQGGAISIPMKLGKVALPVTPAEFTHTPPEFGAFVLLRRPK